MRPMYRALRDESIPEKVTTGQAIKEGQDKYRFPAGFRKHLELFNIDRLVNSKKASAAVKSHGIIVTEGFTDVMRLHQNGFRNSVAIMGSSLSREQMAMLTDPAINPTKRVTLFLDADEAGRKGRQEAARLLIHDAFVRYIDYTRVPNGELVDEPTEPEHFTKEELARILGSAPVQDEA